MTEKIVLELCVKLKCVGVTGMVQVILPGTSVWYIVLTDILFIITEIKMFHRTRKNQETMRNQESHLKNPSLL